LVYVSILVLENNKNKLIKKSKKNIF
jgi:hypothetical protein